MTRPLPPPPRRDPQALLPPALVPPAAPSRAALALAGWAALGQFRLQRCGECGAVPWPPRDACPGCLGEDLAFVAMAPAGTLLAQTTIHVSPHPYFRMRSPWRIGTVRLDAPHGPSLVAHLHGDVPPPPAPVRLALHLDRAGQPVLVALPAEETPHMADDPVLRALTSDPRHRRVLISDGRAPVGAALVPVLLEAGAAEVLLGVAQRWRGVPPALLALGQDPRVRLVDLAVDDPEGLRDLAGLIGGTVDLLIATGDHPRPGGILAPAAARHLPDQLAAGPMALLHLAQAFAPAMAARTGDGVRAAAALVAVVSAQALAPAPGWGTHGAAQAASLAVLHSLRAELRLSGLRVVTVLTGPVEEPWRERDPPPKLAPQAVAQAILRGLQGSQEEIVVGDVAADLVARWRADPALTIRELGHE